MEQSTSKNYIAIASILVLSFTILLVEIPDKDEDNSSIPQINSDKDDTIPNKQMIKELEDLKLKYFIVSDSERKAMKPDLENKLNSYDENKLPRDLVVFKRDLESDII